jgi:hypothetical protein
MDQQMAVMADTVVMCTYRLYTARIRYTSWLVAVSSVLAVVRQGRAVIAVVPEAKTSSSRCLWAPSSEKYPG